MRSVYIPSDLKPLGTNHIVGYITTCPSMEDLVAFLGAFAEWHGRFAAGVANLAGEVAARESTFEEGEATEVAKYVFFAAVDEFGVKDRGLTHRGLARRMVEAALEYPGLDRKAVYEKCEALRPLIQEQCAKVAKGYGVGTALSDHALFRCLGFHLGSENLADQEFNALHSALMGNFPQMVKHLKDMSFTENGKRYNAYVWIKVHTHVEEEHAEYAIQALDRAFDKYRGSGTVTTDGNGSEVAVELLDAVHAGYRDFAECQRVFLEGLTQNRAAL